MSDSVAAPGPRIRIHRAGAGLAWVQRGLRLFARQPFLLVALVGLGILVLLTISLLPGVGNIASLVLAPFLSLGALAICRSVDRGQAPAAALYFVALRDPLARLRLLQLGLFSAVYMGLTTLLLSLMPGGTVPGGVESPATPPASVIADPAGNAQGKASAPAADPAATAGDAMPDAGAVAASGPAPAAEPQVPLPVFLATMALLLPYMMAMWFAPVLSGWHGLSAPKALFFSFFTCWRNRTAMLVYLLTLLGVVVIAVMVLGSLIKILNATAGVGLFLLVAPLVFVTAAIAQSANLEMIKDVIDADDAPDDAAPDTAMLPPA